ncbi:hypothetical protein PPERSA_01339 [Pseudocohnilembus persalinus]|uniref:Uncharacterized protein n=1 Tax=Pseudocohnilembus persalinus TaxID=266149 RepID=A0A0V0QGZ9_PSEPJ|nr:hypothetical protein PPERSA_01339 [Pseudocohnilembus persalinus]|eukprot:KRX01436.1 hypothetical protein PPERSA_01339 [Pseudocohnilembus persalinus]
MDKLQLPHAKLFYFASELYKSKTINENEKLRLKEMVINDEPEIFELLEKYQANGNEEQLKNSLLGLLRPHEKHLYQTQPVQHQQQTSSLIKPIQASNTENSPQQNQQQQIQQSIGKQQQQQQQQQESEVEPQNSFNKREDDEKIAEWINLNPGVPDEISSPLGLQLLKRKKKQKKEQKDVSQLKPFLAD